MVDIHSAAAEIRRGEKEKEGKKKEETTAVKHRPPNSLPITA